MLENSTKSNKEEIKDKPINNSPTLKLKMYKPIKERPKTKVDNKKRKTRFCITLKLKNLLIIFTISSFKY